MNKIFLNLWEKHKKMNWLHEYVEDNGCVNQADCSKIVEGVVKSLTIPVVGGSAAVDNCGYFFNKKSAMNAANCFAKNDKHILDSVHHMCIESLSPDMFKIWENIKNILIDTRENL